MVEASSLGLAGSLTDEERSAGLLYPRIERSEFLNGHCLLVVDDNFILVREISAYIAKEVIRASQKAVRLYVYHFLPCSSLVFMSIQ